MNSKNETYREAPLDMDPETFRTAGYQVVDSIADFLAGLAQRPIVPGKSVEAVRTALGRGPLPETGKPVDQLLVDATKLLLAHSTFNGHPRFWGYITSSAAPVGALGDLLAAALNGNVGAWQLAPIATEIEAQTIRWIAELIGYPADCGGILVSGGNMANFTGFLAARHAQAGWDLRRDGLQARSAPRLLVYTSQEVHTWLDKAADLFGLGLSAIRHIPTDGQQRMKPAELRQNIEADLAAGHQPFLVVGSAGTVSTGAVDPLPDIAAICREYGLWFHVDGAYGAFAAALPECPADLQGLRLADSLALDPHKWLYAPLEAGCTLVRDPAKLAAAFSFHPAYYRFDGFDEAVPLNLYAHGLQNSRGFRALKVWLAFQQAGRAGYVRMIREDIQLAQALYQRVDEHPEIQAFTHNLSITTFRYVPPDLSAGEPETDRYLNDLNEALLKELQNNGEIFLSNAVLADAFVLRTCIVNFRTTLADVEALPEIVTRYGRTLDAQIRPPKLSSQPSA